MRVVNVKNWLILKSKGIETLLKNQALIEKGKLMQKVRYLAQQTDKGEYKFWNSYAIEYSKGV